MRYCFTLFVTVFFAGGALVLAAPTDKKPTTGVKKEDVKLGDIYWPRLRDVEPKDPAVKVQCIILARNNNYDHELMNGIEQACVLESPSHRCWSCRCPRQSQSRTNIPPS